MTRAPRPSAHSSLLTAGLLAAATPAWLAAWLPGCDRTPTEPPSAAAPSEPVAPAQRAELRAQLQERLPGLRQRVERLRDRAGRGTSGERVALDRVATEAEQKLAELRSDIERIDSTPAAAWHDLNEDLRWALEALKSDLDTAYDTWLRDEPGETLRQARRFAWERREDFVHAADAALRALDAGLVELEAKAAPATGELRARYDAALQRLRDRRAAARSQLERFAETNEEEWEPFKTEVTAAVEDLRSELQAAMRELGPVPWSP